MHYTRLAGCGLLVLLVLLTGCGKSKGVIPKGKQPLAVTHAPKTGPDLSSTAPRTSEEWRAYGEQLKNERDDALRIARGKDGEIEAVNQRIKEQEQAEIRKEHAREAAIGRRIAVICFAVGTLLTILSFLPIWWAKLIPKAAGPLGAAAGVALLAASHIWVWVADHIFYLSLGAGVLGSLVVLFVIKKGLSLMSIRQWFTDKWDAVKDDAEELRLKADTLEREIKAGVHAAGQALRGKPLKTMEDVAKLRAAALDAERKPKV